jgi:putative drug exporter of the RND superfamily
VLHQPINWSVQAMAFIVLVAVGADYNLLLITRIREESRSGIRSGIIRAVRSTGGVITSAGIIFAASMFGLLFGSLSTMTQIGFIIGMGLLIDTFVVRTITVPAMAAMVGKANWWPSKTTHATDAAHKTVSTDSTDTEVAPPAEIPVQAVAKGIHGDFSHRLATNNIRRSAARRRRTLAQHSKRVRRLSVAGDTYSCERNRVSGPSSTSTPRRSPPCSLSRN